MSKSKGSRWERKFVAACEDLGLSAQRVPLSGAMAGYPGDVIVNDRVEVECKYRRNGTGFKRLYNWLDGSDVLTVTADGCTLVVQRLETWAERFGDPDPELSQGQRKSASSFTSLCDWIGESDILALRMPRSPWLIVEISS